MIKAIVYTSNTGYTAEYARLLADKTGLAVYSLKEAKEKLAQNSEIIYLGWLMASRIQGYKKANKLFCIKAVCGVGMAATGEQINEVGAANAIPQTLPIFTLRGGLDMNRLHGIYKFMMKIMNSVIVNQIEKKENRTPDDEAMLDMINNSASYVSEDNLSALLEWYRSGI